MRSLNKVLASGGLVIFAAVVLPVVQAQDYVDVEAERAGQSGSAAAAPYDPYQVKPAQAYPATSYGASTGTGNASSSTYTGAATGGNPDQNLGNLLSQLQQLQQEVMMLNGKLEEQEFELRKLKEQSQERYVDLDRRLTAVGAEGASVAATSSAAVVVTNSNTNSNTSQPAVVPPPARSNGPQAAEQPGEGEAYRAAYGLVRGQQWQSAVTAFQQFLRNFPDGRYAPNAHYWLGELYLVIQPPQLESARQSFMLLLTQYPENNKVPDALYKLGKVHYQKGNREKGREYLDRVINEYGNSNSSAVQLAQDFIDENY